MDQSNLLIIFAENPKLGRVKAQLAKSVGERNAFVVYLKLLEHTHIVASRLEVDKAVFYSQEVEDFDILDYYKFPRFAQKGKDVPERIIRATGQGFAESYSKVVVIGPDCYELDEHMLEDAFKQLDNHQVVVGPALSGGFYLFGMRQHVPGIFKNLEWEAENLLLDLILNLQKFRLSYKILPTLQLVDVVEDLGELKELIQE